MEILTKKIADGSAMMTAKHKHNCDEIARAGKSFNDNTQKYWDMVIAKLEEAGKCK
jgi:hypothetical protein